MGIKFEREHILNYATNTWHYNRPKNVGKLVEEIRKCEPKTLDEWKDYYIKNVFPVEHLEQLGERVYVKITEVMQSQLDKITLDECVSYVKNLVFDRTFDGYQTEITTIRDIAEKILEVQINMATHEFDSKYAVDYTIDCNKNTKIGLQIKPVSSSSDFSMARINDQNFQASAHKKFTEKFKGTVFYIYSMKVKGTKQKKIVNEEVIDQIKLEIKRLNN